MSHVSKALGTLSASFRTFLTKEDTKLVSMYMMVMKIYIMQYFIIMVQETIKGNFLFQDLRSEDPSPAPLDYSLLDQINRDLDKNDDNNNINNKSELKASYTESPYSSTPHTPPAPPILPRSSPSVSPLPYPSPLAKSPECDWLWDTSGDWSSYGDGYADIFWGTRQPQLPRILESSYDSTEINTGKEETRLGLTRKGRKLTAAMRNFTVTDFTEDRVNTYEDELMKIAEMRDNFVGDIEDFLEDFEKNISITEMLEWNESIKEVEEKVRNHALAIRKHAISISARKGKSGDSFKHKTNNLAITDEDKALAWAEAKYKAILNGDDYLNDEMAQENSEDEEVETVEKAMRSFKIQTGITKSLTLTATDDMKVKDHIV